MDPEVVVVGAGLAGLACAVHLHSEGVPCRVLEASDGIGGRVRTDVVDGFRLDRGFQVLLSAYPEARDQLDLDALRPRFFEPGALVRREGGFHRLGDPFRRPGQALATLRSPIGGLAEKLKIPSLRRTVRRGTLDEQFAAPEASTAEFLREQGIGPGLLEGFFRPFLGGVFLDPELATSSRMFRFVFRMFSEGDALVPAEGMGAIPAQLAAQLPDGAIHLHTAVEAVEAERVVLAGGEELRCGRVVVATDGSTAARLIDGVAEPAWNPVANVYFEAERAPIDEPVLILDGEGVGPVNNLCFPTQVAPEYGPEGRTLVSATAIGDHATRDDLVDAMRAQMTDWFGEEVAAWRHLRTYRIARALPRQEPGWLDPVERPVRTGAGIYVAGDHLATASSHGALGAGRRAAEAVLRDRAEALPATD